MKNITTVLILLCFTIHGFGQDRMYVTAKSGLTVRSKPALESNKLFKLPNNYMVFVSRRTGISLSIIDEGKEIMGEWVLIQYSYDNRTSFGYVFDSYLSKKKPEIWYSDKNAYYKTYSYDNLQDGSFEPNSTSKKYLNKHLPTVQPHIQTLTQTEYPYYLNPQNRNIVLFENHNLNNLKPVGILKSLTQVRIDSTFHKYKFKDLTNCVWNRIIIHGEPYYIDYDIHDYTLTKKLTELNQNLVIVGQDTGYDGAYHLGYPEYFFMLFTDNENEVIYKTEVLDFFSGDEFAMEEDILQMAWNNKNKSYEITLIGHKDKIRVDWNGKTAEIEKL